MSSKELPQPTVKKAKTELFTEERIAIAVRRSKRLIEVIIPELENSQRVTQEILNKEFVI